MRDDNRRVSNGEQVSRLAGPATKRGKSEDSLAIGGAILRRLELLSRQLESLQFPSLDPETDEGASLAGRSAFEVSDPHNPWPGAGQ